MADTQIQTQDLEGGAATPGNSKYYGTDSGGAKGFFPLPGAGGGIAFVAFSRGSNDGTAVITYPHTLGVVPSKILFFGQSYSNSPSNEGSGTGIRTAGGQKSTRAKYFSNSFTYSPTTQSFALRVNGDNGFGSESQNDGTVQNVTATDFDVSWVRSATGGPVIGYDFQAILFA